MAKEKKKRGCPTGYIAKFDEMAKRICQDYGATDVDLARLLDIHKCTLQTWKKENPSFKKAIREGKEDHDTEIVVPALLKRAIGYDEPWEEVIETEEYDKASKETIVTKRVTKRGVHHYPPDVQACRTWTYNRDRPRWSRDPQELILSGNPDKPIPVIMFGTPPKEEPTPKVAT